VRLDLASLGLMGRCAQAHGWTVRVTWRTGRANAVADQHTRTLKIRPVVWRVALRQPRSRYRLYVVEHELAHMVDHSFTEMVHRDLTAEFGITATAAAELLADAWCLRYGTDPRMSKWVADSAAWHSRVMGSKYTVPMMAHPVTIAAVERVHTQLEAWGAAHV